MFEANTSVLGQPAEGSVAIASRGIPMRRRWRLARLALLAPLIAVASGCASYMSAEVTSFHQLSAEQPLVGKRFAIEPSAEQRDSLEFRAYADLIRQALARKGLVDAGDARAEVGVSFRYSIGNGKLVTYGYPAYGYASFGPVWGWTPYRTRGGGVQYAWAATYPLSYGVVGTNYGQAMLYRRELRVEITDLGRSAGGKADATPARLFEGTAVTEGESASLAPVMPAMVRALFSEFPGESGVSRIVRVTLDNDDAAAGPAADPPVGPPAIQPK